MYCNVSIYIWQGLLWIRLLNFTEQHWIDMFSFVWLSVMSVGVSVTGSWLWGSAPLRSLPVFIQKDFLSMQNSRVKLSLTQAVHPSGTQSDASEARCPVNVIAKCTWICYRIPLKPVLISCVYRVWDISKLCCMLWNYIKIYDMLIS